MRMLRKTYMALVLCLTLLAVWTGPAVLAADGMAHKAPGFTVKNLDGKDVSLADYENEVVILTFWATWCGACHKQIPALRELYENYRGKGVTILAVSLDSGGEKQVREFVKRKDINYQVLLGTPQLAEKYGVRGIPTSWIIGKQGRLGARFVGPRSYKDFEKAISDLL